MSDGLVLVDKPPGPTSHDVVARTRRLAGTRRVGHAGTLDPPASGLLVVGVGRATRLLGHLALGDKSYTGTVRLGVTTVTDDATGDVLAVADAGGVTDDDVARGVRELTGPLSQVPSRVSAVKVAGVRAYDLVRAGADVVLAPRHVVVTRFDVLALRRERLPAGTTVVDADVAVDCSSGTYVRALARDLGAALGVGGHLTTLRRTRVGPYRVADAVPLAALGPDLPLIGLGEAAAAAFPRLDLDAGSARRLVHGVPLGRTGLGPGPVAAFGPDGTFLALVADAGPVARSLAVFVG